MGPNSYLLLLLRFQRVSLLKMEEKDILLMHAFLPCLLSFFSLHSFSLLCYFSFNSLYFSYLRSSPFPFVATVPIYTGLILSDFSILPLWFHQLFMVYGGHSFKVAHQPLGCPSTTTTWHAQCILFIPLLVTWQISLLFDLRISLSPLFEWIRPWGFSLPTSVACIEWS